MSDLDILIDEHVTRLENALEIDDDTEYRAALRNVLGEFANRILGEARYAR